MEELFEDVVDVTEGYIKFYVEDKQVLLKRNDAYPEALRKWYHDRLSSDEM